MRVSSHEKTVEKHGTAVQSVRCVHEQNVLLQLKEVVRKNADHRSEDFSKLLQLILIPKA